MIFEEKTIKSETIYKGKIINLRRDTVTVKNGTSIREIVEHKGGAVLAAITNQGKMVMIKQFRKPAERVIFEVPAGKIDPGEDPLETGKRELKEETGYTANTVKLLTKMYPTVGYSEEVLYIYLCTGLTLGATKFDYNEAIDIEEHSIDDLYKMAMEGQIEDAKTIVAILMVKSLELEGKLEEYLKQ